MSPNQAPFDKISKSGDGGGSGGCLGTKGGVMILSLQGMDIKKRGV